MTGGAPLSALEQQNAALSELGLSAVRARELVTALAQLHDAEDHPYEALDALLLVSSLEPSDDAARTFLMGGGVLDALADLICICDEEWVSGDDEAAEVGDDGDGDSDGDESLSEEERHALLDLCSRALNALGSMCSFAPFLHTLLEEDCTEEPLDAEVVAAIAPHINTPAAVAATGAAARAALSPSAPPADAFQLRRFGVDSGLASYPILTAVLFWLRTARHRGPRAQAVFALSWLLTHPVIVALMCEVGLSSALFELLQQQFESGAGSRASTGSGGGALTPDISGGSGGGGGERVSVAQDNLRLYLCICIQRLSRSGVRLFSDPMDAQPATGEARLQLLLHLLHSVHSFNVRAILLNVLLHAVTPLKAANQQQSAGAGASSADLILPPSALQSLHEFRSGCGSIGSSHSSRRTSPALGALAPPRTLPPAVPGGMGTSAAAVASSAGASAASAARSWRAPSPRLSAAPAPGQASPAVSATPSSAASPPSYSAAASAGASPMLAAASAPSGSSGGGAAAAAPSALARSAAVDDESGVVDDDEVAELSRDPEAGVDKTAHLQQLVDAIVQAAEAAHTR